MSDKKTELKPRKLGFNQAPWPTVTTTLEEQGGQFVPKRTHGKYDGSDGNSLIFHTQYDTKEDLERVYGTLNRQMPTPNMLPAFEELLSKTDPKAKNRVFRMVSDPGIGKTHIARLLGKVMGPDSFMEVSLAKKNAGELLEQTVFLPQANGDLVQKIDDALRDGSLNDVSKNALRGLNGDGTQYFSEKGERAAIDWSAIGQNGDLSDRVAKAMDTIIKAQGWGGLGLGVNIQTIAGPLKQASIDGKGVFLADELEKCMDGTEVELLQLLQVATGEVESYTHYGKSGTHTFTKENMPLIIFTENRAKDGKSSKAMADSFSSRVPKYEIPNFDQRDWAHRASQQLTGLPITTMYELQPGQYRDNNGEQEWVIDNPEYFSKAAQYFRSLGFSKQEAMFKVPEEHLSQLANWEQSMKAAVRLGNFYDQASQMMDLNSPMLKNTQLGSELFAELDDPDNPITKFTPRTMIRHLNDALKLKPKAKAVEEKTGASFGFDIDWDAATKTAETLPEPAEQNYGSRLTDVIMEDIFRMTEGKPKLRERLLKAAKETGIIGEQAKLADLLNIDPELLKTPKRQAQEMQILLGDLLKQKYPDILGDKSAQDILPLSKVELAIRDLEQFEAQEISPLTNVITVPNSDIETANDKLFRQTAVDNIHYEESLEDVRDRLPPEKLLTKEDLLASLTLPHTGKMNLQALWNKALTAGDDPLDITEESVAIAQNQSQSDIATTSLVVQSGDESSPSYGKLHIVHNSTPSEPGSTGHKTLIVGDADINPTLKAALEKNRIAYVNANAPNAREEARLAYENMLTTQQFQNPMPVKHAFLLRNSPAEGVEAGRIGIAELLTNPEKTRLTNPNFVTSLAPEEIPFSERIQGKSNGKTGELGA